MGSQTPRIYPLSSHVNKTRLVSPKGIGSTQREDYHHLLAVSENFEGEPSPGWKEKHPEEVAMEEAVIEARAKEEVGN